MTDVVLTLPVRTGEEALMFGRFLNRFLENLSREGEAATALDCGPPLMMRAEPPIDGREVKVLTFQERPLACAFASGWARLCGMASGLAQG